ncbi:MAG TPA: hypothetical protein VJP40_00180 [bacterium]|nr:hypothetical protein [bacterium]
MFHTVNLGVFLVAAAAVLSAGSARAADPLPCPEPHPPGYVVADPNTGRDAGGNCNLTRTGPDGKIEQLKYMSHPNFKDAAVYGRGLAHGAPFLDTHDARYATVTLAPGGYSRWHNHPGVNFTAVISGVATYYTLESDGKCIEHQIAKDPSLGAVGFLEIPNQVHAIVNESNADVVLSVLFLKKESDTSFTGNADQPSHPSCPQGFNP